MLVGGAAAIALAAASPALAANLRRRRSCSHCRGSEQRPAAEWTGPYDGVPPWDQVKPELFPEAFQFGIDEMLRETDAIANNPAAPTFANTIEAMEKSGAAPRPGAVDLRRR